jgi:hypothetical protein
LKDLITDKIFNAEEQTLSDADIVILKEKRKKQLRILYTGILPLAAILLYVFINGISVIESRSMHRLEFDDEDTARFYAVIPYVSGFGLLLLIGFFTHYYIRTLAPVFKDIKKKKKLMVYFIPEKTEMSVFSRYYISSPVQKQRQVQITYEDFYMIAHNDPVILELAPFSRTILRFTYKGKEIKVS